MSADLDALTATFGRGTARAGLPKPDPGALGQVLRQIERPTPEQTLLARAALAGLHAQAGRVPVQAETPAPVYVEDGTVPAGQAASPELLDLLQSALHDQSVLPELLARMVDAGVQLTATQALPLLALRDDGRDQLSAPLWALLDGHARWLAALNRDWSHHDPASPSEPLRLGRLRRQVAEAHAADPEGSAPDLLARWPRLKGNERRTALQAVAASLHPADLTLLDLARQDRLDDVRLLARSLPAHLPGELADQVRAALKAQLLVDKKGKLRHVPGEVPAALRDPKPPKNAPEEPDLALLLGATPLETTADWLRGQYPAALGQLANLRVGVGQRYVYADLERAAYGGASLDTLLGLSGHLPFVPFWPQERVRERLWEAIDRLLGQPSPDAALLGVAGSLLATVHGPLVAPEAPTAPPEKPGLLQRLRRLVMPDAPQHDCARLHRLFVHVLNDLATTVPSNQHPHLNLLSALVLHLDPDTDLPALPPVPAAKPTGGKPTREKLGDAQRREWQRSHLEQAYAQYAATFELRRRVHTLLPQGARP